MNITDRIFAIKNFPLFSSLRDSELVVISEIARPKAFSAGKILWRAGKPTQFLFLVVSGSVLSGQREIPKTIGIQSLLYSLPLGDDLLAGPEGCEVLMIGKGHFFTMLHECPGLAYKLLESTSYSKPKPEQPT